MAVAVAMLVAACGQRSGVHAAALRAFEQPVGTALHTHGASAKTRGHEKRTPLPAPSPVIVDFGKETLLIPSPTPAPDGTLVLTYDQWGAMLLRRLDAPVCVNNVIAVVAWAEQESTLAGWNPLATTFDVPGATLFNPVGVRNYVSLGQGLDATIGTIEKGWFAHGYREIVQALRACTDPMTTAVAINASDWCRGCSEGTYVLAVVPRIVAAFNRAES